jgi:hypothetical protein
LEVTFDGTIGHRYQPILRPISSFM